MWPLSTAFRLRANRWLIGCPRPTLIALTFGLLAIVGVLDYVTGSELSVLIFYLGPVALAAWYLDQRFAVAVSLVSVGVWIVCGTGPAALFNQGAVVAWNALIALGIFLVTSSLLASLRNSLLELEQRVRQRTASLTAEMAERQRLEREVLDICEREQRRIGNDLHDGLGQHLTGTALAGQVLTDKLAGHRLAETADAERIVSLIEDAIDLTRNLARGLSPLIAGTAELAEALSLLAADTTAHFYVQCEFRAELLGAGPEPEIAMHLYRLTQESISNAVRHGHASGIQIALTEDDAQRVTLRIRDNGIGLPAAAAEQRRGAQGLRIMAHRARLIGAALDVSSHPEGGTEVRCVVPAAVNRVGEKA